MLPVSANSGKSTPFLDAVFTAVSAVCVTGLVVQDTASYWSGFGQAVILLLIQIGGMGVITIAVFIAILSGKKIGLMQRSTMQEAISAPNMRGIVKLTHFILTIAFVSEALAAVIMIPTFCQKVGLLKGCWYALFHAVSAFCNAGFDLMGSVLPYSSLTGFRGSSIINFVIMFLIIWGGIGFLTWDDIWNHRFHIRYFRMQSKVILITTIVLIFIPAIYFYFFEFSRGVWGEISVKERFLASAFQAVTPRTAGFNTVNLIEMRDTSKILTIVLMLIGGSPGSTAGGIKTTTLAVLVASTIAVFRRNEDAHYFGRRISVETVRSASAVFMMYICLFMTGGIAISLMEELPILDCLFETASAIGTVGLTLGITPGLGTASRLILISLMYLGRVGGLTLIFAATSGTKPCGSRYPQEKITVG